MVFPYAGTPSSASVQEPVLFQHNASTQQQPTAEGPAQVYGYPFQAPLPSSQSTHPALINFQQPVYSQPSTKVGTIRLHTLQTMKPFLPELALHHQTFPFLSSKPPLLEIAHQYQQVSKYSKVIMQNAKVVHIYESSHTWSAAK